MSAILDVTPPTVCVFSAFAPSVTNVVPQVWRRRAGAEACARPHRGATLRVEAICLNQSVSSPIDFIGLKSEHVVFHFGNDCRGANVFSGFRLI